MNKLLILFCTSIVYISTNCLAEPVHDESLDRYILHQKTSFEQLDKARHLVEYKEWTEWDKREIFYTYVCEPEIKKMIDEHFEADMNLDNKILRCALGDGFCIGIVAALFHKIVYGNAINQKTLWATLLAGAISTYYQNKKLGIISYYTFDLSKQENERIFSSISRYLLLTISAGFSFLGTSFSLSKIVNSSIL